MAGLVLCLLWMRFGNSIPANEPNDLTVYGNICRIDHARWEDEGERLVFTITADRFLRNMVRAIVGTLVDVGRGKITVGQFCEIIEKKDRCEAGTSVPGNALFLWDITYPYIS